MKLLSPLLFYSILFNTIQPKQIINDWKITNERNISIENVQLPATIYSVLYERQIIPYPLKGKNDVNLKWISKSNWTFSNTIDLHNNNKSSLTINFGLIDTISEIFVNGESILKTKNQFITNFLTINVTSIEEVLIQIKIFSPVTYAEKLRDEAKYPIFPECPVFVQNGECFVNELRKTQSSFSWDWGPSFPTQGIYSKIQLVDNPLNIYDCYVIPEYQRDMKKEQFKLIFFFHIENEIDENFLLNVNIFQNDGNVLVDQQNSTIIFQENKPKFIINLSKRIKWKLWWPLHYGEQTRYRINFQVQTLHKETVFESEKKIGFRRVRLIQKNIQNQHVNGSTFYFEINHVKIYIKGSNIIPLSSFLDTLSTSNILTLTQTLRSAELANMNMLRVWGGGRYEFEEFYDMADTLGIMIWQDFMFACSLYRSNGEYLDNVKGEVEENIKRLLQHPSVVVLAGNNENEQLLATTYKKLDRKPYYDDYRKLYKETIEMIVRNISLDIPFIYSSPSNNIKNEMISNNPNNPLFGDVHFYNYSLDWWVDQKLMPNSRFVSEFGIQSMPSFSSWAKIVDNFQRDCTIDSDLLFHRQHHFFGNIILLKSIKNHFPYDPTIPSIPSLEKFKDFIYLSQIDQAIGISRTADYFRSKYKLNDTTLEGLNCGIMYWQLNDVWQAPTWSSIEYGGKWKILHYYMKTTYEPFQLTITHRTDNMFDIILYNDHLEKGKMNFLIKEFQWNSINPVHVSTFAYQVNSSEQTSQIGIYRMHSLQHCCFVKFFVEFSKENSTNSIIYNRTMFCAKSMHNSNLQPNSINITSVTLDPLLSIATIKMKRILKRPIYFVNLDIEPDIFPTGETTSIGYFSPNVFHMIEDDEIIVTYTIIDETAPLRLPRNFSQYLSIRSMNDVLSKYKINANHSIHVLEKIGLRKRKSRSASITKKSPLYSRKNSYDVTTIKSPIPRIVNDVLTNKSLRENNTRNVNLNTSYEDKTLLHYAIEMKSVNNVQFLLNSNQVKLDIEDENGKTAIAYAIEGENEEIMNLVIERAMELARKDIISLNTPDKQQQTYLHSIVRYNRSEIIKKILSTVFPDPINVDAIDNEGYSPLHLASYAQSFDIIQTIVNYANVNKITKNGDTPLHIAAVNNDFDTIRCLCENNASPFVKNHNGKLPQDLTDNASCTDVFCQYINFLKNRNESDDDDTSTSISLTDDELTEHDGAKKIDNESRTTSNENTDDDTVYDEKSSNPLSPPKGFGDSVEDIPKQLSVLRNGDKSSKSDENKTESTEERFKNIFQNEPDSNTSLTSENDDDSLQVENWSGKKMSIPSTKPIMEVLNSKRPEIKTQTLIPNDNISTDSSEDEKTEKDSIFDPYNDFLENKAQSFSDDSSTKSKSDILDHNDNDLFNHSISEKSLSTESSSTHIEEVKRTIIKLDDKPKVEPIIENDITKPDNDELERRFNFEIKDIRQQLSTMEKDKNLERILHEKEIKKLGEELAKQLRYEFQNLQTEIKHNSEKKNSSGRNADVELMGLSSKIEKANLNQFNKFTKEIDDKWKKHQADFSKKFDNFTEKNEKILKKFQSTTSSTSVEPQITEETINNLRQHLKKEISEINSTTLKDYEKRMTTHIKDEMEEIKLENKEISNRIHSFEKKMSETLDQFRNFHETLKEKVQSDEKFTSRYDTVAQINRDEHIGVRRNQSIDDYDEGIGDNYGKFDNIDAADALVHRIGQHDVALRKLDFEISKLRSERLKNLPVDREFTPISSKLPIPFLSSYGETHRNQIYMELCKRSNR
ncbi:hypothetical protein SNEBB_008994 [Seison nebaliae]|nr:hypothetical protein SNEBB_008994 [Seison nebaliae]